MSDALCRYCHMPILAHGPSCKTSKELKEEEHKRKMIVGSYEISWNKLSWKDWAPFMVTVAVLSLVFIGFGLYPG